MRARVDSNRSVFYEDFCVFFVRKLVNLGPSICILLKRYLKMLAALSRALIRSSFVGLLVLSFQRELGRFPRRQNQRRR